MTKKRLPLNYQEALYRERKARKDKEATHPPVKRARTSAPPPKQFPDRNKASPRPPSTSYATRSRGPHPSTSGIQPFTRKKRRVEATQEETAAESSSEEESQGSPIGSISPAHPSCEDQEESSKEYNYVDDQDFSVDAPPPPFQLSAESVVVPVDFEIVNKLMDRFAAHRGVQLSESKHDSRTPNYDNDGNISDFSNVSSTYEAEPLAPTPYTSPRKHTGDPFPPFEDCSIPVDLYIRGLVNEFNKHWCRVFELIEAKNKIILKFNKRISRMGKLLSNDARMINAKISNIETLLNDVKPVMAELRVAFEAGDRTVAHFRGFRYEKMIGKDMYKCSFNESGPSSMRFGCRTVLYLDDHGFIKPKSFAGHQHGPLVDVEFDPPPTPENIVLNKVSVEGETMEKFEKVMSFVDGEAKKALEWCDNARYHKMNFDDKVTKKLEEMREILVNKPEELGESKLQLLKKRTRKIPRKY